MRKSMIIFLISVVLGMQALALEGLPLYSTTFDKVRNPHIDLSTAMQNADKNKKKILLIIGVDSCKWCGQLDNFLEDHEKIAEAFYGTFEVVRVYYGNGISEEGKSLLNQFSAPKGTPHFYLLDSKAKLLKSIDTGYLERGYSYNKKKFMQFIEENR